EDRARRRRSAGAEEGVRGRQQQQREGRVLAAVEREQGWREEQSGQQGVSTGGARQGPRGTDDDLHGREQARSHAQEPGDGTGLERQEREGLAKPNEKRRVDVE